MTFTGEKCPLTFITQLGTATAAGTGNAENAENIEGTANVDNSKVVEVETINILGSVNNLYAAVTLENGEEGYIQLEEVSDKIPLLDIGTLSSVTDWYDLTIGSNGERVRTVQQILSDEKLLEGSIDGAFGSGTAASVSQFQKNAGLEETGIVDVFTWFRLMETAEQGTGGQEAGSEGAGGQQTAASEPLVQEYPPVYKVEDKFASIYRDVENPQILQNFLDPVWKFNYDVFDGQGTINYTNEGIYLGELVIDGKYIDRLYLSANLHIEVQRGEKNIVSILPVLEINTTGSYRPYIQEATVKYGNVVCELETIYSEGGLDGLNSTEMTWILMNEDLAELLMSQASSDELLLRIHGLHHDYDMDISAALNNFYGFVGAYVEPEAMIAENTVADEEKTEAEETEIAETEQETETEEETEIETEIEEPVDDNLELIEEMTEVIVE